MVRVKENFPSLVYLS